MAASSSKGIKICITDPAKAGTTVTPTAIAAAAGGSGIEVTAPGTFLVGEVVKFGNVGFTNIDNKSFVITKLGTGKFTIGNVVLGAGTISATPTFTQYAEADLTCLCLSSLGIKKDAPTAVSAGTFCDPTATIAGTATSAGSLDFAGYVDVTQPDYQALIQAEIDGRQRIIRIMLPSNGYIVAPVTIDMITWDLPLDGAVGFSGSATMASKPVHVF